MNRSSRITPRSTVRKTRSIPRKVKGRPLVKTSLNQNQHLAQENRRLKRQVKSLQKEVSRHLKIAKDSAVAQAAMAQRHGVGDSFTQLEHRDESLINLLVAATRLHADLDRSGVLTAIREILSDVVGCRAMAILELDHARGALSPMDCVNVKIEVIANITIGAGPIGTVALTGAAFFSTVDDHNPIACIPLKVADRITGVIAVFSLLDQKLELRASDRELLEWLSPQAGLALHRATIQSGWRTANGVAG
jgi:hypothetical protein